MYVFLARVHAQAACTSTRRSQTLPFVVRPLRKDEGGGYLVEFPDLPGCMADGATPEEAVREVQIAKRAWLKVAKDRGRPIPKPTYRPAIYQLAR